MKITIVNAHWNNRGDEGALIPIIKGIQRLYPDSSIQVLIKDANSVEQPPQIENVDFSALKFKAAIWDIWLSVLSHGSLGRNGQLKMMVRLLKRSDLIVYSPGGSVINDRFFWWKQMEYLTPFICAKIFRKPLFIAAPSIGPFEPSKHRVIRKWLLKVPQVLCVREDISQEYLSSIGITKNVEVTIDSAFLDEVDEDYNAAIMDDYTELKAFLDSHEKVVGVTITDFRWHVKYNRDPNLMERINESFRLFIPWLSTQGYGVLFIPQLFGNQNDLEYMNGFKGENTFTMSDRYDTYFQQYVIGRLFAVIGMRYHSNIFAAKMCTPFLAVSYEEKMQGFMEMADLTEYNILLAEISQKQLKSKFKLLQRSHDRFAAHLHDKLPDWRGRAQRTIDRLASMNVNNDPEKK